MHFDVVFTRSSVFVDVPFCFCTGKFNFFQSSIYPECSLLGGFDFGKVSHVFFLFDGILMEFYVCLGVNLMDVPHI